MPIELKDWQPTPDEDDADMPTLSLSMDYIKNTTALDAHIIPSQFRELDWEDQAELIATLKVRGTIEAFYHQYHRDKAKARSEKK
jgi:hypothetical protein